MKKKDLEAVYQSEKSRGSSRQQTPDALADRRLQREVVKLIMNPGTDQRGLEAILRDFGLREGSPEFLRYVSIWQKWAYKP